jgi:hypothetical protein
MSGRSIARRIINNHVGETVWLAHIAREWSENGGPQYKCASTIKQLQKDYPGAIETIYERNTGSYTLIYYKINHQIQTRPGSSPSNNIYQQGR